MIRIYVDPPEGWKYGFPKSLPLTEWRKLPSGDAWFKEQGYPQDLIDKGMLNHIRFWTEVVEDTDNDT